MHGKIPRWWPPLEGDSSKKDREIVYGWSVVFRNSTVKRLKEDVDLARECMDRVETLFALEY